MFDPAVCVHRQCQTKKFRRGVCGHHYHALYGQKFRLADTARKKKDKPLSKQENNKIDNDEFWDWMKTELKIAM